MKHIGGAPRRAEGQIIVVLAVGLVALILAVGLVVDGGMAFLNRRDAQNTADLAALAGTKVVADLYVKGSSPVSVSAAVARSVQDNNCGGPTADPPCSWTADYVDITGAALGPVGASTMPGGTVGVAVHINRVPRTFLLRVIGQSVWTVNTTATAMTLDSKTLAPGGVLLPIGWRAPDSYLNPPGGVYQPQVYRLTDGALDVPGNFGWLSWTGSTATNILNGWVCTPNSVTLTLPEYVDGNTGASNSSTIRNCLQYYIDNAIPVYIPIIGEATPPSACQYGPIHGQGNNSEYCVIGVAAVTLTSINTDSNVAIKNIEGFVTRTVAIQPGILDGIGVGPPTPNSQFYYLSLVE